MNKKGDLHLLEVLRDLLIGALVLVLILVPTVYLIKLYYGIEECPNKADFKSLVRTINDLEQEKKIEFKNFFFFNKDCHIVTFTQDPIYNTIEPPSNNFKLPFICLCEIKNNKCWIEEPNLCFGLKTFNQIGSYQFNSKPLDQNAFLSFRREDQNLLINAPTTQTTKVTTEEKTVQEVLNAMEYAKKNTIEDRKCNCGDNCNDYANWVIKYSKEFSPPEDPLDPLLIVAMMMKETKCNKKGCNLDGPQYSCGMMQVKKTDFTNLGEDFNDPETGIKAGVRHLKRKYNEVDYRDKEYPEINECYDHKSKWEKAIHAYNGWTCKKAKYIEHIMKIYKKLENIPDPLIVATK